MRFLSVLVLFLPNPLNTNVSSAYVQTGLPGHKHRAWLKKMTTDICQLPPGQLTPEDCLTTPLLLSAWAQNPWIPHNSKSSYKPSYKHRPSISSSSTSSSSSSSASTSHSSVFPTQQDSYISTSNVYPHHGKECALACEQLLKRLIDERRAGNTNAIASTQTYNALINVWSKSGEKGAAAQRAEEIVVGMSDAYAAGEVDVQPDLESFKLVLRAWSQAKGEENAPFRAQQVLEWMISLYESGQNELVKPDVECFDVVLHTWALSYHPESPQRAEKLIMYMDRYDEESIEKLESEEERKNYISTKPTKFSLNQVLTAWSKVKGQEAAQRAEDILQKMREIGTSKHNVNDLTPNLVSYSSVISAWCKSQHDDRGRKAERILKMAEKHHKRNNAQICLDNIIYNLVIDAHAKTSSNKSHIRARAVLDRLIQQYDDGLKRCKPDVYSFSSVLSSCSNLSGSKKERRQAFEIAQATFDDMIRFGVKPNHVSYGIMLKACSRLIPMGKERRKYVREYFRDACRDGCVGCMVLDRLKDASSKVQYEALLKGNDENNLPSEWMTKVPVNEKYKRGFGHHHTKNHANFAVR